jgi:prepilin-type N-terminal cleavage/methylation domain-containing protein/prepilin-type processing-associated H-X9-DG protein
MVVTRYFFARSLHHKRPTRGGFSLIEMLVVIAIIAVLAAIAFPVFGRMRSSAQAATCTSNLRTLHQASMNYAADNGGLFPMAINPTDNFAITLACQGYLGLSGSGFWERLNSWIGLSQRRAPFALWCPAAEACEARAPYGNMATYSMNVFVGGDGPAWRQNGYPTLKTWQVTTASKTSLYMDGCFASGRGYDVRVGESGLLPAAMHPPALYKDKNNPARSVNVVFVDGHVEMRRIGDIPTSFNDVFWKPNKSSP